LAQNNQGQNDQGINLVVPNGTYALRDTGQVTLPGSTPPIIIAAAGRIAFIPTGTIDGQVIGKTRGVTDGLNQRSDQSDHDQRLLLSQSRW
jgi:hypothetical protein